MKRILLIGANFRNKGAEAMALTAVRRLTRLYPGVECVIASYAAKEAIAYGLHEISDQQEPLSFRLIRNRKTLASGLRVLFAAFLPSRGWRQRFAAGDEYLEVFHSADLVIDLSGFALTDKRPLSRRLVFGFELFTALVFRVPFVVFTQALGPFRELSTRMIARLTLPWAKLIFARGESTVAYLHELGIDRKVKVIRCADSAYLFPADVPDVGRALLGMNGGSAKPLLGIVPNINIYQRTNPQGSENPYIRLLAAVCDFVQTKLGANVVFVCHERYEDREDDEWLSKQVLARSSTGDQARIISAEHSAGTLKAVIGELDFLIASRFHSLVAAISSSTPCMALAWAHKYNELFAEVGLANHVFDAQQLDAEVFMPRLAEAWDKRSQVKEQLQREHDKLIQSAQCAYDSLKEILPA